jgi:hypothetical protein
VVGLASAFAAGLTFPAVAAAAEAGLTLSPTHGPASTLVSMSYAMPRGQCQPGGSVSFVWEGVIVGTTPISNDCKATAQATAPAGHKSPGEHLITAAAPDVSGVQVPANARFVIDPGPTASTPAHTATPTPTPTPAAAPTPTASSSCQPDGAHVTGNVGYLLAPPLAGSVNAPGFVGAFTVHGLAPASALPLGVNLVGTPPVTLTVKVDAGSQALAQAVMVGTPIPCVRVDMPGGPGFEWVNYAFANVLPSSYQLGSGGGDSVQSATLVLEYASASFAYQPTEGDLVTGTDAAPASAPGSPFPWLWVGLGGGVVVLLGGGIAWWLLKPQPPKSVG